MGTTCVLGCVGAVRFKWMVELWGSSKDMGCGWKHSQRKEGDVAATMEEVLAGVVRQGSLHARGVGEMVGGAHGWRIGGLPWLADLVCERGRTQRRRWRGSGWDMVVPRALTRKNRPRIFAHGVAVGG